MSDADKGKFKNLKVLIVWVEDELDLVDASLLKASTVILIHPLPCALYHIRVISEVKCVLFSFFLLSQQFFFISLAIK